jgi:hypothetical protein
MTGRPDTLRFVFTAEVWEHEGTASWYFVSLPHDVADAIEEHSGDRGRGFGSVRVDVTIGATRWQTSVFPDAKRATYVLPLKKAVRVAEHLDDGSIARIDLLVAEEVAPDDQAFAGRSLRTVPASPVKGSSAKRGR